MLTNATVCGLTLDANAFVFSNNADGTCWVQLSPHCSSRWTGPASASSTRRLMVAVRLVDEPPTR